MTRTSTRLVRTAVAVLVLLGVAGCGSSGTGKAADPGPAEQQQTTTDPGPGPEEAAGDVTTIEDPAAATGSGTATLAEGRAEPDKTITFEADGTLDKTELTVAVGEKFTFIGADKSIHAICVAGSDCLTVYGDLYETFTIDKPGTYRAVDEIDKSLSATITVT